MYAVQVNQEDDGTFVVSETGQSPQKLTRNVDDLYSFLAGKFRITDVPNEPQTAYQDDTASFPGNTEHPSNKPKGNQPAPDATKTTKTTKTAPLHKRA